MTSIVLRGLNTSVLNTKCERTFRLFPFFFHSTLVSLTPSVNAPLGCFPLFFHSTLVSLTPSVNAPLGYFPLFFHSTLVSLTPSVNAPLGCFPSSRDWVPTFITKERERESYRIWSQLGAKICFGCFPTLLYKITNVVIVVIVN
jgi:hypothetical protein